MAGVKGRSGGSNRKSVSELQLTGGFRKDKHGHLIAPDDKLEKLVPQEHLTNFNVKVNREEIFNYFADYLFQEGTSQKVDSILVSQLVEAYAMYVTALNYSQADPEAVLGRKLASAVALDAAKEVRILMSELRMTPSTRGLNEQRKDEAKADPVGEFLNLKVVN